MQESFLNSPLIYSIALTLIHFLWQGVLIALALKTVLIFTSNKKSQLRYAFSSAAMVLNLILPIITFFIIYKPGYLQLTQKLSHGSITGFQFTQSTSKQSEWYANLVEYLPYLTIVWLCVISVLSLKLLIELYSVNQLPKHNTLAPDNGLLDRFKALSHQVGVQKVPRLLLSLNATVPMAIGWIKPIVLIPVGMLTGLTPAQLDMLLLHELAHIRRYDYIVNFVQSIVEIILFFHPCVLWVSNQMRNEREYCSDDIAVKHCGNPIAYAHTLADTASLCNKHRKHSIPKMAMAASGGDLTQRVLRLVNEHHCASSNLASKWMASLTILSILLLVSSQQIILLLETELHSANYTTRIEIFNSPALTTNDKVFKSAIDQSIKNTPQEQFIDNSVIQIPVTNTNSHDTTATNLKTKILAITEPHKTASILEKKIEKIPKTTVSDIEAKLDSLKTSTIQSFTKTKNKSIADLAFEQTDSTLITSSLSNPYAKQLTELTREPNLNEKRVPATKIAINNIVKLSNKEKPMQSSSQVETLIARTAELIYSVPPRYPPTAKRKGIELEVMINFTIDSDGRVKDIIFPTLKHQINYFKASIRSAVRKWRFIPAQSNNQAIDSKMSKIFSFSLYK